ncbi:uncharacterized protein LOC141582429 [Saimiri boliviensis]|uniref:uncharacterized protein LOC141582429 n=1 Tax=Saimiri boliviensis TaxID=27679 RepID=UPI003D77D7F5
MHLPDETEHWLPGPSQKQQASCSRDLGATPALPWLPISGRLLPSFLPKPARGAAVAPQLAGHMARLSRGNPAPKPLGWRRRRGSGAHANRAAPAPSGPRRWRLYRDEPARLGDTLGGPRRAVGTELTAPTG